MALRASVESVPEDIMPYGQRQRLLFMGLKRSGKSSILNVVLYKMPPTETVFIPTTIVIKKHTLKSFRTFQIWDLPGQIDFLGANFDTEAIFGAAGAVVWILDAQDDYLDSVARLVDTVLHLQQSYPNIQVAVFIHKVDSLSDDYRDDTVRDIKQRIMDDLNDAGLENPPISYYPTSVYDTSIYEALSKVMQLLIPRLSTFEALISNIAINCKFQKLYLFDTLTKLFVASDTYPMDTASYALLSDWFDTIMDLADLYGFERSGAAKALENGGRGEASPVEVQSPTTPQQVDRKGAHAFVNGSRGICMYLQEITINLVLIGWSKEPGFAKNKPLVDYNVMMFTDAMKEVLAATAPETGEVSGVQPAQ